MLPEKRFLLSDRLIDPNHCTISFADTVNKVELRAMQVLLCLIEHAGKPVSRDMLIETVWRGGHISDNAINRIIGLLRNQLGDNAKSPQFIKTVPKVGYVLICSVSEVEEKQEEVAVAQLIDIRALPSGEKVTIKNRLFNAIYRHTKLFLVVAVAFIVLSLFATSLLIPQHEGPKLAKLQPLTFLKGQEFAPAISPDGRFLSFAHRTQEGGNWRLGLMNVESRETQFLKDGYDNSSYPTFSPDGKQLAYVAYNDNGECFLRAVNITEVNFLDSRTITNCKPYSQGMSIAWHPSGSSLYYSDEDLKYENISPKLIYSISVNGKNKKQLSQPYNEGRGDYSVTVSPDGSKLAVIRNVKWYQSIVMVFYLDQGRWETLFTVDYPLFNVIWHSNNDNLYFRSATGQLNQFNISSKVEREVAQLPNKITRPMSNPAGDIVGVLGSYYSGEIWRAKDPFAEDEQFELSQHISSSSSDSDGVVSKSGLVAFISSRSGTPEIWLRKKNGAEVQLSNIKKYSIINELSFSYDESKIVGRINSKVFVLNVKEKSMSMISGLDNVFSVSWAKSNNEIIVSKENKGEWSLDIFDVVSGDKVRMLSEDGIYGKYNHFASSYVYTLKNGSLFEEVNGASRLVSSDFDVAQSTSWQVYKNFVYRFLPDQGEAILERLDLGTGEVARVNIPGEHFLTSSFSLSNNGDVLLTKVDFGQMDVVKIIF